MNALRLLVLLTATAAPVDDARGFHFVVPAGFEAQRIAGTQTWQRATQGSPSFALFSLTGLGGTIAQTPSDHTVVEASAREAAARSGVVMQSFVYRSLVWRGLELEVLETRTHANGSDFFQLAVQLPFAHEAMQVGALGPASNGASLRTEFDTFIQSFEGPVTWKTADQRRDRQLGQLGGSFCGLLFVLAVPLAAWLLFRKSKTRPS